MSGHGIDGSCRRRHSATLRAPTPAGSSDCTRFSAICISCSVAGGSSTASSQQFFQRRAQVAVVVERFDDGAGQRQVARRQRQHVQLAVQVRVERGLDGHHLHGRKLAVVGLSQPGAGVGVPQVAIVLGIVVGRGALVRVGTVVASGHRQRVGITLGRSRAIGQRVVAFLAFEERVAAQRVAHHLRKVQRRHLQQAHRMLQPRRQALCLPVIGTEFQGLHGRPPLWVLPVMTQLLCRSGRMQTVRYTLRTSVGGTRLCGPVACPRRAIRLSVPRPCGASFFVNRSRDEEIAAKLASEIAAALFDAAPPQAAHRRNRFAIDPGRRQNLRLLTRHGVDAGCDVGHHSIAVAAARAVGADTGPVGAGLPPRQPLRGRARREYAHAARYGARAVDGGRRRVEQACRDRAYPRRIALAR